MRQARESEDSWWVLKVTLHAANQTEYLIYHKKAEF